MDGVKGKVHHMFYGMNIDGGSVNIKLTCETASVHFVTLKVYQNLVHYVKTFHLNVNITRTDLGMKKKVNRME